MGSVEPLHKMFKFKEVGQYAEKDHNRRMKVLTQFEVYEGLEEVQNNRCSVF
jgi:hypothetical protein